MAHITFLGLPAPGHVHPTLPVVAELVRRGHRVDYLDSEEFREPIAATGARFQPYAIPLPASATIGALVESGNLARVALLVLRGAVDLLGPLLDDLRRERPDVLVHDSNALWGAMAARILGLPSVASVLSLVPDARPLALRERLHLFAQGLPVIPGFLAARRRLVRAHGAAALPPVLFPARGDLNLLYTCREMQPPHPFVDESFHLVGTSVDPDLAQAPLPFAGELRPPLAYVAAGTLMAGSRFLATCVEALRDHPGTVLMSTGRARREDLGAVPAHFVLRPHVPQLAVLSRADLFVTHGGMNSVHEALYFGVPLVVVAHNAEWAFIGRRVEACGAGLLLGTPPYGRVGGAELRDAIHRVRSEVSFRRRAGELSESLRRAGGYRRAADRVEGVAAGPR